MNNQSSHSHTTNSNASSSSSSSANKLQKPHPPLIDVDCNLLHPDLISILNDSYLSTPDFQSRFPPDVDSETTSPLSILHHPSTTSANIAAVISPSSTIEESQRNVRLLESVRAHARDEDGNSFPADEEQQRRPLHLTNGIEIKTTVGVHPYHTESVGPPDDANLAKLRTLLAKTRENDNVIACIGETGLDYSPGFPPREHQLPWFRAQLDLAWEYNLPLFLHERAAFEDAIRCIDEAEERHRRDNLSNNNNNNNNNVPNKQAAPKILIHCFTGTYNECLDYIQRGYHISLSGYVLKPGNAEDPTSNHDVVRQCLRDGILPWNKLMIETDAPYMGFESCRETFYEEERRWAEVEGKESPFGTWKAKKKKSLRKGMYPNVPGALDKVLEGVWEEINAGRRERGEEEVSLEELARITTENAVRFFGLECGCG